MRFIELDQLERLEARERREAWGQFVASVATGQLSSAAKTLIALRTLGKSSTELKTAVSAFNQRAELLRRINDAKQSLCQDAHTEKQEAVRVFNEAKRLYDAAYAKLQQAERAAVTEAQVNAGWRETISQCERELIEIAKAIHPELAKQLADVEAERGETVKQHERTLNVLNNLRNQLKHVRGTNYALNTSIEEAEREYHRIDAKIRECQLLVREIRDELQEGMQGFPQGSQQDAQGDVSAFDAGPSSADTVLEIGIVGMTAEPIPTA